MVVHVDGDLPAALGRVGNTEAGPDLDLVVEIATDAEQGSKDAVLVLPASEVVVQDARERERRDDDRHRPGRGERSRREGEAEGHGGRG